MKDKKKGLILVFAFVLVLVAAYVLYTRLGKNMMADQLQVNSGVSDGNAAGNEGESSNAQESEVPSKVKAPEFTVFDKEGNAVQLSAFIGKPIVLNFWASWCGPCQREMPDFNDKSIELDGKVQFMMVNMTDGRRETVEVAAEFVESKGYTFPVFYDQQGEAAMNYGAYSLPTTFFIDKDGYVIAQATGAIDAQTLQKGIDMIMEEVQ